MKFFKICRDPEIAMKWYDAFPEEAQEKMRNAYVDAISRGKSAYAFESFVLVCYNVALKESKIERTDMWGVKK